MRPMADALNIILSFPISSSNVVTRSFHDIMALAMRSTMNFPRPGAGGMDEGQGRVAGGEVWVGAGGGRLVWVFDDNRVGEVQGEGV